MAGNNEPLCYGTTFNANLRNTVAGLNYFLKAKASAELRSAVGTVASGVLSISTLRK